MGSVAGSGGYRVVAKLRPEPERRVTEAVRAPLEPPRPQRSSGEFGADAMGQLGHGGFGLPWLESLQ
jgi:hypothetical protein